MNTTRLMRYAFAFSIACGLSLVAVTLAAVPAEAAVDCWDLNANGLPENAEDTNDDGRVDVLDCRGEKGDDGTDGKPGDDSPQIPRLDPIAVIINDDLMPARIAHEDRIAGLEGVVGKPAPVIDDKRVFVSSALYTGDLGGVRGADIKCKLLASQADPPLPGNYKAWLSVFDDETRNTDIDAVDEFTSNDGVRYVRTDGVVVARRASPGDLQFLDNPINKDESGNSVGNQRMVWTGTDANGRNTGDETDCDQWRSDNEDDNGTVGDSDMVDFEWTEYDTLGCDEEFHIYCFEQ